jgi:hypothetical protein
MEFDGGAAIRDKRLSQGRSEAEDTDSRSFFLLFSLSCPLSVFTMTDSSREQAPVRGLCVYGKVSCKWGFAGHESTNVTIPGMLPARYVMISLVPCIRCPLSTIPCCTCVESPRSPAEMHKGIWLLAC